MILSVPSFTPLNLITGYIASGEFLCPVSKIDLPSGSPSPPALVPTHLPCEHVYLSSFCF